MMASFDRVKLASISTDYRIAQGAHARREALQKAEQERRCDDERAAADRGLIERMPILLTMTRVD